MHGRDRPSLFFFFPLLLSVILAIQCRSVVTNTRDRAARRSMYLHVFFFSLFPPSPFFGLSPPCMGTDPDGGTRDRVFSFSLFSLFLSFFLLAKRLWLGYREGQGSPAMFLFSPSLSLFFFGDKKRVPEAKACKSFSFLFFFLVTNEEREETPLFFFSSSVTARAFTGLRGYCGSNPRAGLSFLSLPFPSYLVVR